MALKRLKPRHSPLPELTTRRRGKRVMNGLTLITNSAIQQLLTLLSHQCPNERVNCLLGPTCQRRFYRRFLPWFGKAIPHPVPAEPQQGSVKTLPVGGGTGPVRLGLSPKPANPGIDRRPAERQHHRRTFRVRHVGTRGSNNVEPGPVFGCDRSPIEVCGCRL